MGFAVGQKVRLCVGSRWVSSPYNSGSTNPIDSIGCISHIRDIDTDIEDDLYIRVLWGNGTRNSYNHTDLLPVTGVSFHKIGSFYS